MKAGSSARGPMNSLWRNVRHTRRFIIPRGTERRRLYHDETTESGNLKRRYGRHGAPEPGVPWEGEDMGRGGIWRWAPKGCPGTQAPPSGVFCIYLNEDKSKMMLAFFCVVLNTASTLAGSYMLRPIINTFIAPLTGGPEDPAGLARPWLCWRLCLPWGCLPIMPRQRLC